MKLKNNILKTCITLLIVVCHLSAQGKKADLVIFSYNRPIQLYALLESTENYVEGLQETHVIYRATQDKYEAAYQEVQKTFPFVLFHKQGKDPRKDFKPLTLQAAFNSPSDYILFAVDDDIVKDFIDIENSIELLEQTNAYGFYFRLGLNLNRCYPLNKSQKVPPAQQVVDDVYMWHFNSGQHDWNYPNTVDMTLYKKSDIKYILTKIPFYAPNSLEGTWARYYNKEKRFGLCHEQSKIVNLPINKVQQECQNRTMNALGAQKLLELFTQGLKINIIPLFRVKNKAAHMDHVPTFIER